MAVGRPSSRGEIVDAGDEGLLPKVVCPNCGSGRLVPLTDDTHRDRADISDRRMAGIVNVKCLACGTGFRRQTRGRGKSRLSGR